MKKILILLVGVILFSGCWSNTAVVVSTDFNETVDLDKGSVPVKIQDQHTEIIDIKFLEQIADLNLTQNTSIGDTIINVSTTIAPLVGNVVCFKDGDGDAFLQDEILGVTPLGGNEYQLILQMPLDHAFDIKDGCSHGNTNWAVDGSVTSRVFSASPSLNANGTSWDITRILFECSGDRMSTPGDATPDYTAFFIMDPIPVGAYLRQVNGITKNIFAAQNNGDIVQRMYDLTINTALNKNGLYTAFARRGFNGQDRNGVTIRLDADTNDRLDWVIQDNLTAMTNCETIAQGHIVE